MGRIIFDVMTGERSVVQLTAEEIAQQQQSSKSDADVPGHVSRFQARAALYQTGMLDTVEAFMANSETDMMLRLAWQDAQTFRRESHFVTGMAQMLGLTETQLDELFIAAAQIE